MRRTVGIAVGTVLASSVVVGGLSAPAQAVSLPGLAAFGISPLGYESPDPADVAKTPGGIASFCMLGVRCPTSFFVGTNESVRVFVESAGTAKSKKQAGKRLAQARSADVAGFAAQGGSISWSKVKLKKATKAKGIKVWAASIPLETGELAKFLMAQAGKRIAYVVAFPDSPTSDVKFSAPLIKLVAGKKRLPVLSGVSGGYAKVFSNFK